MFHEFKEALDSQWKTMNASPLFRTGIDKDLMWTTYLGSFPAGTNPLYRKRTEHDCSCCRQFIRAMGDVVTIVDGKLASIWDIAASNFAHHTVASAMSALVKSKPIDNIFLHTEASVGTDKNYERAGEALSNVLTWEHFHARLPNSRVLSGKDIGPKLADARATHDVLWRGLMDHDAHPGSNLTASKAITLEALATVIELIDANALYRGEENKHAVAAFRAVKLAFSTLQGVPDHWVWLQSTELPQNVSRIRNTAIGTLLVELSEGMDTEAAVGRFERMVAPQNYRRPTALVTPGMIAKAKATVEELGLTSALHRRYAHLTDITVNNVLYADRSARRAMTSGAFDGLATAAPVIKPSAFDKVEMASIEDFLVNLLPSAESVELLVENRHAGNFVSLIAPEDPKAGRLFRWDNDFSWSYAGDVADAVKERVKQAGGNVTGDLCCRLAWSNRDDLDFHMFEPTGHQIFFGHKQSTLGGSLDVDMNVRGETRSPVENIFYGTERTMREGEYRLVVHCYTKREGVDVGFTVDIDWKGTVHRLHYPKAMRHNDEVQVARLLYTKAKGIEIIESIQISKTATQSRKIWNIDTQTFQRASVVMFSPNHWDGHGVGNRHYFFMLAAAENDGTARGFYNEFLRSDLDQHRKVLEMVGAKMRTEETAHQLSGLGFSSTQRADVIARVKAGSSTRVVRVTF